MNKYTAPVALDPAPVLPTAGIEEVYILPTSFAQRRLWFLHQLEPRAAAYNMSGGFLIRGPLDADALRQSLGEVVRRHEILRTTFLLQDDEPVQAVATVGRAPLPGIDLTALVPEARERERQVVLESVASRPFDLRRGPLLRCVLLRLGEREHAFLYVMHHIVTDGWSEALFIRELATLYHDFLAGLPPSLPELPIQYGDFAQWQRDWLQGEVLERLLAYWQGHLEGASTVLDLPCDHPRPALFSYRGSAVPFTVPAEVSASLRQLQERETVTLFSLLLAAYGVLLDRHTGQPDLLIGSPVANRNVPELEELIGLFLDILVLRLDLSANPTFRELLAQAQEVVLGAHEHQDLIFERLLLALGVDRDPSRNPLFQVALTLQNTPAIEANVAGLEISPLLLAAVTAKFDLQLTLQESGGSLHGAFEYATDLFEETTVRRLADRFLVLLGEIVRTPDGRVRELPLLSEAERVQLLVLAGSAAPGPVFCLHEAFAIRAAQSPESVAVLCEGEALTYRELDCRSGQLAVYLQGLGVRPEVPVGICMERSLDLVVAILGVLKAGGAYLPIDTSYPPERIAYMLADAAAPVLLTRSAEAERLPDGISTARIVRLDAEGPEIFRATGRPAGSVSPWNGAYIIYTSGSTGRPKGVVVSHANVARLFDASRSRFGFGETDVWTLFHSHAFDFSVWEIWGALLYGGRLVVVPYLTSRSPELFADLLEREGVTVLNQTPSAFRNLLSVAAAPGTPRLERLRLVIFGGEALEPRSLAPWWERHEEGRPELINMYGITETTVHVTDRALRRADLGAGSVIGRPLPHLEVHLLNSSLVPVPIGVAGEIYVGGGGLARGYLGRPALTAERFVPDPFAGSPGARLYRTGDLARWCSGGELEYLGRIDDQVKIRGFRIELGEIEAALLEHPAVRDAVVTVREEAPGERRLVAYLVAAGEGAGPAELRSHLERDLPAPMIPAAFVFLERLPLTPHGKIDRRALPALGPVRGDLQTEHVPPRTPGEEAVAAAWSAALGVGRVGAHDSFFALGGDSIRTLKAVALLRERGFDVSVQQIFLHPVVAELARTLRSLSGKGEDTHTEPFSLVTRADRALLPAGLEDAYPLSGLQGGMLFHMQESADSFLFHNLNSHHLRLSFDPKAFERVVLHITARHPVLRTSFDLTSYSEPLQLVHLELCSPFTWDDLRSLGEAEQQERIEVHWREQLAAPFDLPSYPQVRFHVHWRATDRFQFTLTENHAVLDGWSLHTLYSEILTCYFALLRGEPLPDLPPLASTFRDFIRLERQALASEASQGFWSRKLDGCSVLKVPRRERIVPLHGSRASLVTVPLATDVVAALRELAQSEAVSLKSVFLAVHCKVMSLLGGTSDVLTGVSSNGRPETPDGQNICGLFLNTLPLRVSVTGDTWKDLVHAVHSAQVEALPHRRYPLSAIQAQRGQELLLEVSFVHLNFHVMDDAVLSLGVETAGEGEFVEDTNFVLLAAFIHGLGSPDQVALHLTCNRAVIDDEQIREIEGYYRTALRLMAAQPAARHDSTPLLSEAEMWVLEAWSGATAALAPDHRTVHGLFETMVEQSPEALCLEVEGRGLSFREVERRANRFAQRLRRLGVGPEVIVALWLDRSEDLVVALLGVLKAGGAYLPIDPAFPNERVSFLLRDSGASVVVTRAEWTDRLPAGAPPVLSMDRNHGEEEPAGRLAGGATAGNLAYVLYTSGSTGLAKGVGVEHRQLISYLCAVRERLDLPEAARHAHVSTFSADLGNTVLFPPLCFGGTLRILSDSQLADPNALVDDFSDRPVDCLKIVPSQLSALLDHPDGARLLPRQRLVLGGEAVDWRLVETVRRYAPDCRIFNHYGPTETTVGVVAREILEERGLSSLPGPPLGRPLGHACVYVLGPDGQPVPLGTPGELYIGGRGVTRGYIGRPDFTAERFVPDPFGQEPGARLYRTGDVVRWLPGGDLEFLRRQDQQVKIRGFRVEPGEVENVLRSYSAIREAVVVARGEAGAKALVAYVVAEGEASEGALRRRVAEKLPPFMVPEVFVFLEKLPLSPNGKIDRGALPKPESPTHGVPLDRPVNELELQLLHIWEGVLGTPQIGVTDDFFELGGNSLLALRLIAQIRKRTGQRILLSSLIDHRTIRSLGQLLHREVPSARDHLVAVQPHGGNPPLYFVHPGHGTVVCYLDLAHRLGLEQPFYGLQSLDLDEDGDPYISIEEMAFRYVRVLREAQPEGPYLLGGWSFGGLVAFEMAQQMLRAGESVPRVLLLDSRAPVITRALSEISPELIRVLLLIDEARGIAAAAGRELPEQEPHSLVSLNIDQQIDRLSSELAKVGAYPPDVDRELARRYFHMRMARIEAMNNYQPKPYDGRIVLYRTNVLNTEIPLREVREIYRDAILNHPSYGWSGIAREVEIEPVPGHHESMIREPNVRVLAAALEKHVAVVKQELAAGRKG
jgi:amino acid adenylation domain-containing protein